MKYCRNAVIALLFLSLTACTSNAQQPGVEQFKKVFEAQLQQLKPTGFAKRTVKFGSVTKGTANSGYFPFKVTAYIHDYGSGYPANKYYGQTCLSTMEGWKFDMRKDDFGDWIVQGRFTVTDNKVCSENPSEGTAAIPLAGVPGTTYTAQQNDVAEAPIKEQSQNTSQLYIGEYACYGTGSRLLAGMGFKLKTNGSYNDLDGKRSGKYVYNKSAATISFKGGFLDGQVGKNVKPSGFKLSNTVTAEPWR
jgi:hypothetical protein